MSESIKDKIQDALLEMVVQKIATTTGNVISTVTGKPLDSTDLYQRFEKYLDGKVFQKLTVKAFENFEKHNTSHLLDYYFDEHFMGSEIIQQHLLRYIIGDDNALELITNEYLTTFSQNLHDEVRDEVRRLLKAYTVDLRAILVTDETYGLVLLARDSQTMQTALNRIENKLDTIDKTTKQTDEKIDEIKDDIGKILRHVAEPPSPFANISADYRAMLYTSTGAVRNEKAPLMKKLVGRDAVQAEIFSELSAQGRVLIQGFGGDGKTALTAVLADEWLRAGKGAVLWLRAGSATAATLAEACATTFNAQEIIAKTPDENNKLVMLKQILQQTPATLLVLDDCWNPLAVTAFIKTGIPGNIAVLATSRQRIASLERKKLDALDSDFSLGVLQTHMTIASADEPAARTLCTTLYGSPFALEIAAITMRENGWNAAEMLAKVDNEKLKMMLPDEAGETGRENIAALIAASREALPQTTKNVFDAWGAFFVPTITPELMADYFELTSYMDTPPSVPPCMGGSSATPLPVVGEGQGVGSKTPKSGEGTDAALLDLQKHGLVTRIPPTENAVAHYRLHDLAFEYTQKLATTEMKHRAVDACLRYTARYKAPSLPNFAAQRPELPQFMAASTFAMQHQRHADVDQFAWDLYTGGDVGGILMYQGFYSLALSLLQQAAAAAKAAGNHKNEGAHLGNLGLAYADLRQYDEAIDFYEESLEILVEIGDRLREGNALGNLGNAYRNLGDYAKAIDYHKQALEISREIGDRRGEGSDLDGLGIASAILGDYTKAIDYYEQALIIRREIGDRRGEGGNLGNLGIVYVSLSDYTKAIDYHQQALTISRQIGDRRGEANHLNNLGVAYEGQEDYSAALDYYEQSKAVYAALGLEFMVEKVEENIAWVRGKVDGS